MGDWLNIFHSLPTKLHVNLYFILIFIHIIKILSINLCLYIFPIKVTCFFLSSIGRIPTCQPCWLSSATSLASIYPYLYLGQNFLLLAWMIRKYFLFDWDNRRIVWHNDQIYDQAYYLSLPWCLIKFSFCLWEGAFLKHLPDVFLDINWLVISNVLDWSSKIRNIRKII